MAIGIWACGNVLSQADEKATVRASLRQLDGYEVESVRDQELLKPMKERAVELRSWTGLLSSLGQKFTPVGYVDKTATSSSASGTPVDRRRRPLHGRQGGLQVASLPCGDLVVIFGWAAWGASKGLGAAGLLGAGPGHRARRRH